MNYSESPYFNGLLIWRNGILRPLNTNIEKAPRFNFLTKQRAQNYEQENRYRKINPRNNGR